MTHPDQTPIPHEIAFWDYAECEAHSAPLNKFDHVEGHTTFECDLGCSMDRATMSAQQKAKAA